MINIIWHGSILVVWLVVVGFTFSSFLHVDIAQIQTRKHWQMVIYQRADGAIH